ncbi:hypothetical protein RND81_07G105900 [Saponaria officinalis]|uniref:C3H1-type domain-containing protein n=1 Tax=Saponaria officinalis TaxID=3572 RepID=A0AAW1JM18_SAPOF
MSFSDHLPPFVPYTNGVDSLGFSPQFRVFDEQIDKNSQIDYDPPSKRAKNSDNHRSSPPVNPPVNQPNGRIFFKTRHCVKFRMGQCKNGENCNFAHGDDDLRQPPPNWQELVSGRIDERGSGNGNENWEDDDDDDRIIHKMKLCKRYYNGEECPYGERCNFLHKDPPKFRDVVPPPRFRDSSRESSAISIGTTGPPPRVPDNFEVNRGAGNLNVNVDALRGNSRPVYWKTRMCTRFETTGFCPFGDTCHFAHGQAELLLPGGRPADSEPTVGNSTPLKQVPPPTSDPTLVKTGSGFHMTEIGLSKKPLSKWDPTKKMNRIYGDWLDDLPLVLPNEVNC